jgi:hypothetical protein
MNFALAREIADAVLYEGYLLYPYRRSAVKNRFRWQFGVVAPRGWSEQQSDPWEMQTDCLIEPAGSPLLDVTVRFLQVQGRPSDDDPEWEEGVERKIEIEAIGIDQLAGEPREVPFELEGDTRLSGLVRLSAEPIDDFFKVRIRIENLTEFSGGGDRTAAMRRSLTGTHTLMGIKGGLFVSLIDPPAAAARAARSCYNLHTWPVLVGAEGSREVMLSSPIVLQDYPAIAPESRGSFFDGTEIDELLTLRVMTLTEDEKREARATDQRARGVVERCDAIPPEALERLHGTWRSPTSQSVEDFFNPPGPDPKQASLTLAEGSISRGSRVRLAPKRRADSMDLFLAGRTALVQSVHRDLEDRIYVAVTVDDDPAAEIHGGVGRYFYFHPDELQPLSKES